MYAEILIEYPSKKIDKYFTYKVPFNMQEYLQIGMKVKVPFNSKVVYGFVINITNNFNSEYELKEIDSIVDKELILNKELIKLGHYIKEKTLCPLISAYQAMLPSSLKIKEINTNYNYYKTYLLLYKNEYIINEYILNNKRGKKQNELLQDILNEKKVLKNRYNYSLVKSLINKGLIKEVKEQEYRINKSKDRGIVKYELNEEQKYAYEVIKNTNKFETFLLEGVTGSGKTEVYLNLMENVINNGKTAILLLPEISLTMQVVNRFYAWFGSSVAIFHSQLSNGEKYDEYLKILRGEVSVVIGTRSAIFMPLQNLGIVIIDEEHSDTYKQESTPRYNAIDVAKFRCNYHNVPLVLGSATPLLETRSRAIKGVYKHLFLRKRAGLSNLPQVKIVDMQKEREKGNFIFSEELIKNIKEKLEKKEQMIILLNRRGFSTIITCSYCGYTYKCPNCDITLTYHKSTNNLRCHYCGYTTKKSDMCPNCWHDGLNYLGLGTEKVEMELKKLFPKMRIIRMDQDTTTKKGSHEKIINDFKNYQYDCLLGTQMISKGLDFPKVSLVGIINADSTLNIPDFRSNERTFSLLYQASGRAGRSDILGSVIIQTFNPDNTVLKCVENNNFNYFYNYEMNIRKILKYPPYYYLIGIKVIDKDYKKALESANKICTILKDKLDKTSIVLGPSTHSLFKANNMYRFSIVIKYRFDNKIMEVLKYIDEMYLYDNTTKLEIDIDPVHI